MFEFVFVGFFGDFAILNSVMEFVAFVVVFVGLFGLVVRFCVMIFWFSVV